MFGPNGASRVFAKQKGATKEDIDVLDNNLQYLNSLFIKKTGKDVSNISGAGAAGAASSGMLAFLNARIVSGIDTILDLVKFDEVIKKSDYVFTGEGKLDCQSFDGKLISGVLRRTKKQNIKTICVCGRNDLKDIPNGSFYKVFETSDPQLEFNTIKENASKYYSMAIRKILINLE